MTDPASTSEPPEPVPPTTLVIRDGRHPFEVSFFVAAVIAGAGGLIFGQTSTALSRLLPAWEVTIWDSALLVGGILGLVATCSKFPFSLLIERVALLLFGGLLLTQGIAIAAGLLFTPTGLLMVGFAVACHVRVIQITRDLRKLKQFLERP